MIEHTIAIAWFGLLSIILIIASAFVQPERAKCPRGSYLHTGIRTDGRFECAQTLLGRENDAEQPPGILHGRIYCTGGALPIVVNERIVGCQR